MIDLFAQDLVGFVGGGVLFCAIFATGAFLQVKIIASLRRDQLMAWDIDLAHSIVMIHVNRMLINISDSYLQVQDIFSFEEAYYEHVPIYIAIHDIVLRISP